MTGMPEVQTPPGAFEKFKGRLKELTCRERPRTVTSKIEKINQVTKGWINLYALGSMKTAMAEIDAHLRTRLRVILSGNNGKFQANDNGDCKD